MDELDLRVPRMPRKLGTVLVGLNGNEEGERSEKKWAYWALEALGPTAGGNMMLLDTVAGFVSLRYQEYKFVFKGSWLGRHGRCVALNLQEKHCFQQRGGDPGHSID